MNRGRLVEVTATGHRQVVPGGAGPCELVNRSQTTTVYLGAEGCDPAGQSVIILDPLGSRAVDGQAELWAITQAGTAVVNVVPGGTSGQFSPAQIAQQIAATGVPALRLASPLAHGSFANVAGGTSYTPLSLGSVNQPAVQAFLSAQFNTSPSVPFLAAEFLWSDSFSGLVIGYDFAMMPAGNAGYTSFIIDLPARANQLTVTVYNQDPSHGINLTWTIVQMSDPLTALRVYETTSVAINGYTRPGTGPAYGVLGCLSTSILPGQSVTRLCCTWSGAAKLAVDNNTPNAVRVLLADPDALYGTAGSGAIAAVTVPASTSGTYDVYLPNGPVVMTVQNLGASGNINPTVTLTRKETYA